MARTGTLLCIGFASALLLLGCARAAEPWRVGTSGDYAPFSYAESEGALGGFDVALARAFAEDTGRRLALRGFAWPELLAQLARRDFDVAMSGVTVRSERAVRGRFSVPVATSGAVVLLPASRAGDGLHALDRPDRRIAVNRGGHLERVARARFANATLLALPENDAVRRALAEGRVDAIVTDTQEAPHWQRSLPGVVRLGPFTRDRKAYLWQPDAGAEARALDAWLLASEADGTLAALRAHYGLPGPPTATPARALVAAVGERLGLMGFVAETKRAGGRAVRDRAREGRVLAAARAAVAREAEAIGRPAPDAAHVEAFYRAQIEAAVAIQESVLAAAPTASPSFSLEDELRPALLRIGERMAWLLVRLDAAPGEAALAAELEAFALGPQHAVALAKPLAAIVQGRAKARASSPATTGSTSETP